MKNPLKR